MVVVWFAATMAQAQQTSRAGPPPLPSDPPPVSSPPPPAAPYSSDEIIDAGHHFFGGISKGIALIVEKAANQWGQPNGYILGEEAGGAFIGGLRYGDGMLYTKDGPSPINEPSDRGVPATSSTAQAIKRGQAPIAPRQRPSRLWLIFPFDYAIELLKPSRKLCPLLIVIACERSKPLQKLVA